MRDFVDKHSDCWSVKKMVKVLGISRSGYYKSKRGVPGKRKKEEVDFARKIEAIHNANRKVYGSPKIHAKLIKKGERISRQRVKRIMDKYGIIRKVGKRYKATTDSKHKEKWSPDLLAREFFTPQPNSVWVSDITQILSNNQ